MANSNMGQKVYVIRLFRSTLTIGIIGSIICLAVVCVCMYLKGAIFYAIAGLFAIASLAGFVCIIAYFNYKIEFDASSFTYRSWFGRKHTLRYDDLTAMGKHEKDVTFYAGKIAIKVYEQAINTEKFIKFAKNHYTLNHNGSAIPKIKKKDLFNNHVEQPEGIITVFSFILLMLFSLTIAVGIDSAPKKITAFEEKIVIVESYELDNNHIILFDKNGCEYWVEDDDAVLRHKELFLRKVDEKCELKLMVNLVERYGDSYYTVSNIIIDNDNYMLFKTWYANNEEANIILVCVFLGIDLFMLAIFCFIIYVGRNPHKFSDKFLHSIFAPGMIRRD